MLAFFILSQVNPTICQWIQVLKSFNNLKKLFKNLFFTYVTPPLMMAY